MRPHKIVNGVAIDLTDEEIELIRLDEERAAIEASKVDYMAKRIAEYPGIADQLDMLYKDQRDGTNHWFDLVDSIKKKYPKPS